MSAPTSYTTANFPTGLPAINTLLKIGSGSPMVFNTIANVGDLSMTTKVGEADVTSHSTGSPWDEWIPTLLSGGNIKLPLFFIPDSAGNPTGTNPEGHAATAGGLYDKFISRETDTYTITFPNGAGTWATFTAYVVDFGWKAPVKGVLTADVTFRVTGEPTFSY